MLKIRILNEGAKKIRNIVKKIAAILIVLILLVPFDSCGRNKTRIQFLDADGSMLGEDYFVLSDLNEMSYLLPHDTDEWHYTDWVQIKTSDGYILQAQRVRKTKYIWKNYDGTVLQESFVFEGQEFEMLELPQGNEKWVFTNWEKQLTKNECVYTAVRTPNTSFFIGNVFQIVIQDAAGEPLGTGSGFVINKEGWFITNNHVMDEAASAIAFFDIPDSENGSRYTQLNIIGGVYNSEEKDVFIGKLEGYDSIQDHYHDIDFTEKYTTNEIAYTIGYPNSSVEMEINSGKILEEYSDVYDKINGIYYVLSDCYIAPGSSGGILVNEEFAVIGITTIGLYADDNKQIYNAGGSIPTFVFSSTLNCLDDAKIKDLTEIYN